MTKNNMKKITVCLVAVLLLAFVATKTFASDSILDNIDAMRRNTSGGNTNVENQNIENIAEAIEEGKDKEQGNLNVGGNENTPVKNDAPTETPYTGIGDYSTYIFIGIFAVSAVFAYKKVREYND